MILEIPDWCIIGKTIEWNAPHITGYEWVREQIISYGRYGFFHQAHNCPVYFSSFSEYGNTIRECKQGGCEMYKKKYKITFNEHITIFHDSSNIYYYLLEYVYGIDCSKQEIPETILDICEGAQEWCECANVGEEYIGEKFKIKVIEKCN